MFLAMLFVFLSALAFQLALYIAWAIVAEMRRPAMALGATSPRFLAVVARAANG